MINFRRLSVVLNIGLVLIALILTIDVWDKNKKDAYWAFLLIVAVLSAINFAWVSRKKKSEEPQPEARGPLPPFWLKALGKNSL